MKSLVISCLSAASFLSMTACTLVEAPVTPAPNPTMKTTTTTTERGTTLHPTIGTTETRTTRTY